MNEAVFNQTQYRARLEWGAEGVRRLAKLSDVVVIVDILSFTTCVDIAVSSGSVIFPYQYKDASAEAFARSVGAVLAGERGTTPSLSPASLVRLKPQSRVVLPSPNGSTCTVIAAGCNAAVIAGSIRNAFRVADFIEREYQHGVVSVIACGERWPNGSLRPAMEDLIGCGAILSRLDPSSLSPEAKVAVSAFRDVEHHVREVLEECASGRELIAKGFPEDVFVSSELNASHVVPVFRDGAYVGVP
jgi:2-phosphosulfolactate phosphatase